MRWVGIDEAGYGPNLGPMVMTAVVAETPDCGRNAGVPVRALDLWQDLVGTVDRAGGDPARLWVDDSKVILRGGKGRDRIEAACLAAIHAAGLGLPGTLAELLEAIRAGTPADVELAPWFDARRYRHFLALVPGPRSGRKAPGAADTRTCRRNMATRRDPLGDRRPVPLQSRAGVGRLEGRGPFRRVRAALARVWDRAADGETTSVTGDKHGGRHYYLEPLSRSFCDAWIDRGNEGPGSSRYTIRDTARRLELNLIPKADRNDGLVALASIISKTVRELWMDGFNRYWCDRVSGLRPTAGYPVDAQRFRQAIEGAASAEGCDPATWWRVR